MRISRVIGSAEELRGLAMLLLLVLSVSAAGAADYIATSTISVRANAHVVLAYTQDPITNVSSPDHVVVLSCTPTTPPTNPPSCPADAKYIVLYNAPNHDGRESVALSVGATRQSFDITTSTFPMPSDPNVTAEAGTVVFEMFLVAFLLESAFSLIFNWRVFLEFFDDSGMRTLIMFVGSLVVVLAFHFDFIAALFYVYLGDAVPPNQYITSVLTALVLGGGSAGVNKLLVTLNLRTNYTLQDKQDPVADGSKAPTDPNVAWASFKFDAAAGLDTVWVDETEVGPNDAVAANLLGVVRPVGVWPRLVKYFWRDPKRLPPSSGKKLTAGKGYRFVIIGKGQSQQYYWDLEGNPIDYVPAQDQTSAHYEPTPEAVSFAPGARVDFYFKLDVATWTKAVTEARSERAAAAPKQGG